MKLSQIIKHYVPEYTKTVWEYKVLINRKGTFYKDFVIVEIFTRDLINTDKAWTKDKILWFSRDGRIIMIEGRFATDFYDKDKDRFDKELLSIMVNGSKVQLDYKNCEGVIFDDMDA